MWKWRKQTEIKWRTAWLYSVCIYTGVYSIYTDHALEYTENSVACSIIHGVMSLVSILEGRCSCSLYQDSPSCESDAQLWWRLCQCCCSTRSSNCSGSDQFRPTSASRLHPALFSQWLSGVLHNPIVVHVSWLINYSFKSPTLQSFNFQLSFDPWELICPWWM